jgi:protein TonB
MSGTMTDKGIFFLVLFLALLLVLFIYAVIRVPPELADSQEQPVLDQPEPPPLVPTAPAPQPLPVRRPRTLAPPVAAPPVAASPVPAAAAPAFGGSSNGGYAARHATVAVPVITAPKVSGGPPWGPAPKPPGLE